MQKLIVCYLFTSIFFVQCYTPSEFVRGDKTMESNKSINSKINAQALNPIGPTTLKKSKGIRYSTNAPQVKSEVKYEVILGIVIGGGFGYLIAPKYKFFNNSVGPDGLKYIIGGALIGGLFGYLLSMDD